MLFIFNFFWGIVTLVRILFRVSEQLRPGSAVNGSYEYILQREKGGDKPVCWRIWLSERSRAASFLTFCNCALLQLKFVYL